MLATSTENSCQNSSSRCVGACETLRICAQLEKGKCEFELGGVAVTRILYNYEFKIENCDAHPITITSLKLNMLRRVIAVTEGGNELLVTNVEDPMSNVSPSFNRPEWKLLSLESVCGTANSSDFTGNIDGISLAAPPDEKITLVLTPFTIQPGDCCVSLVFAVDFRTIDNLIIYTEPSVLCLAAQRRIGYDCCILEHSLSIPGECNLRSDRNSERDPCEPVQPLSHWWRLGEDDPGAVAGNMVNLVTVDRINNGNGGILGGLDLPRVGLNPILYSSDVSADIPGMCSSLSVNFGLTNNADGYRSVMNSGEFSGVNNNFAMEVWVKKMGDLLGQQGIFGVRNEPPTRGYWFDTGAMTGGFWGFEAPFAFGYVSSVPIVLNTWTHLAFVRENSMNRFYVNGILAVGPSIPNIALIAPMATDTVLIGNNIGFPSKFKGIIDEARFYTFVGGTFDINWLNV